MGLIDMNDDAENPFRSTIWSFLGFGAVAAIFYALDLKWPAYVIVILGSLITVGLTASTIANDAAPISGRFSPATGTFFAGVAFVCKLSAMVTGLSAIIYGIYWTWTTESWRTLCGSLCY
jgi:hypothetical protein